MNVAITPILQLKEKIAGALFFDSVFGMTKGGFWSLFLVQCERIWSSL